MPDWHLTDLENALTAEVWRIVAHHAGDDYKVSGTWEIQRSTRQVPLFIDFDGLDDMQCLPLSVSYACRLREPEASLYFGKRNQHWKREVHHFVTILTHVSRKGK